MFRILPAYLDCFIENCEEFAEADLNHDRYLTQNANIDTDLYMKTAEWSTISAKIGLKLIRFSEIKC